METSLRLMEVRMSSDNNQNETRPYSGKTAIITGGAGEIGFAIAKTLVSRGAKVGLIDLNGDRRSDAIAANMIREEDCHFVVASVTDETAMEQACEALAGQLGGVDWLVTSAGGLSARPLTQTSLKQWNHDIAVNLDGAFLAARYCIPHMRSGGAIVFVASVTGHNGSKISPAYAAAKGATLALARSLTVELAPQSIRVNCVSPGVIDTELSKAFTQSPVGQMQDQVSGTPQDVAEAVAYLCSDAAAFVNGAALVMTGGQTFA